MQRTHENKVALVTGASKGIGKALCIGLTPTPGVEVDPDLQHKLDGVKRMQKIHRNASVDDYVGPVLFLTSDASKFSTGQVYMIDGGLSC